MRTASLIALAILVVPGVAGAELAVGEDDQVITHDCAKDSTIVIISNNNKIKATGACTIVTIQGNNNEIVAASAAGIDVQGNENQITVTSANKIHVPGNHNSVRYKRAINPKKKVAVLNSGNDNSIRKVK